MTLREHHQNSMEEVLTATRRRRQSEQAPSFLIKAAFSLCCCERGPVLLRLARRLFEISAPSFTEKMDWPRLGVPAVCSVLMAIAVTVVSVVAVAALLVPETVVEMDDM